MFKIFNGNVRGFGENPQQGIYAEISVEFRKHLRYFKGPKLAVFMAITLHADAQGWSTPSLKMLEAETGYDGATVSRTLTELCNLEIDGKRLLLAIQERTKGKFVKNRYLIFPSQDEIAKRDGVIRKPRRTAKTAYDTEPQLPNTVSPNTVPPNTVSAIDGIDPVLGNPSLESNTSLQPAAKALAADAPEPPEAIAPEPEAKREQADPEQDATVKERMAIQERENFGKEKDSSAAPLPPPPTKLRYSFTSVKPLVVHLVKDTNYPKATLCGGATVGHVNLNPRYAQGYSVCPNCQRAAADKAALVAAGAKAPRKAQPKAPNPWSALSTAMHEAIPEAIRPPRCHYAANNNAAQALWEAGFTPERITAYVKDVYANDNWFKSGGAGGTPIIINMSMIEKRIKAWEAKKPNAINKGRYQPNDYVQDPYFKSEEFLNEPFDDSPLVVNRQAVKGTPRP